MLLVMEYVSKGCLSHYLHRHKDSLAQNKLLTFGQEIAEVSSFFLYIILFIYYYNWHLISAISPGPAHS